MAEGGGAILAGEGGRLACEARIKFLARLTVQKLIEAQRFEQMTPAAPIDLSRHLRREMIARGHLDLAVRIAVPILMRSEEHTSELQSLMRISYADFCLKKKTNITTL